MNESNSSTDNEISSDAQENFDNFIQSDQPLNQAKTIPTWK